VALVGGPYPAAGGYEAAVGSLGGGMAAANSVVRTGVGSILCPTSPRDTQRVSQKGEKALKN
jgi:hypothetical protein